MIDFDDYVQNIMLVSKIFWLLHLRFYTQNQTKGKEMRQSKRIHYSKMTDYFEGGMENQSGASSTKPSARRRKETKKYHIPHNNVG